METTVIEKIKSFILDNNGYVEEAPMNEYWFSFRSGTKIPYSIKAKFILNCNGKSVAHRTFEGASVLLHKNGCLNLFDFGYESCSKCGGSGNVGYSVDGGNCWKCNGSGITKI